MSCVRPSRGHGTPDLRQTPLRLQTGSRRSACVRSPHEPSSGETRRHSVREPGGRGWTPDPRTVRRVSRSPPEPGCSATQDRESSQHRSSSHRYSHNCSWLTRHHDHHQQQSVSSALCPCSSSHTSFAAPSCPSAAAASYLHLCTAATAHGSLCGPRSRSRDHPSTSSRWTPSTADCCPARTSCPAGRWWRRWTSCGGTSSSVGRRWSR